MSCCSLAQKKLGYLMDAHNQTIDYPSRNTVRVGQGRATIESLAKQLPLCCYTTGRIRKVMMKVTSPSFT